MNNTLNQSRQCITVRVGMPDTLTRTLLAKLREDLKIRQAEFRNDHAISTAIQLAMAEIDKRLKEQDAV